MSEFERELNTYLDTLIGVTYIKHEIVGINESQNSADVYLTSSVNGIAVRKKYIINKVSSDYIITETKLPEDEKIKVLEEKLASLDISVNDLYLSTLS